MRDGPGRTDIAHASTNGWRLLWTLGLAACGPAVIDSGAEPPEPPTPRAPAVVLVNGTLIDGTDAAPMVDAAVVVIDGRIEEIGLREATVINDYDEVIDLAGGYLMPGIINAHAHTVLDEDNLRAWLEAGVTTVCDVGTVMDPPAAWGTEGITDWNSWASHLLANPGELDSFIPPPFSLRDNEMNQPELARARAAGPFVTANGGYPVGSTMALNIELDDVEDARQKVDLVARAGASYIKIGLEDHWGNSSWGLLTTAQIGAIVEAAHGHGIPVLAHVSAAEQLTKLVDAVPPIDAAIHMVQDSLDETTLTNMLARGIQFVPTLAVWHHLDFCTDYPAADLCQESDNLGRFVAAGGSVGYGDDYTNSGIPLGLCIEELELMEAAGMTTAQVVAAATLGSAEVCNVSEDLGSLEPGKLADMLVVGSDPLADIHNLLDVQLVIKEGLVAWEP